MSHIDLFAQRYSELLLTALGSKIEAFLNDTDIIEIMVNPDGKLWVESLTQGKFFTGKSIANSQASHIIKLVASAHDQIADSQYPEVSAQLYRFQARFQGWLPPIVSDATFTIRKQISYGLSLNDYHKAHQMSEGQLTILKKAIQTRKNILVCGGTGSGKTTFVNALLFELKESADRIIILEDLPELQITSADYVRLKTSPKKSMRDLIKGTLRMRPDRIIIGEVRDGSALDLLKAWNTGHPGGICTVHANSAAAALIRLEDLIQEVIPVVPKRLISQAIDLIVFMQRDEEVKYKVSDLMSLSVEI